MWSFRCKFVDKTLMHFSYSPSVQKCVSMKFIFNKIHYVNLWHFCPLHLQALIDSTWKLWRGPRGSRDVALRVTWHGSRDAARGSRDSRALQPCSSGPPADTSKDKKYLSAWVNWNVSENTFGVIFRNVRLGDDRTVSFPGSFSTPKFQSARFEEDGQNKFGLLFRRKRPQTTRGNAWQATSASDKDVLKCLTA